MSTPGNRTDFMSLKGAKAQIGEEDFSVSHPNPTVSFKCLQYCVVESAGHVEITIVKKENFDLQFGYRTVDGTAISGPDYKEVSEFVQMKREEKDFKIKVPIIDDKDWNPDKDFFVELFDPNTGEKLSGDDTRCQVTIIDEDFPGIIGFDNTGMQASRMNGEVTVKLVRNNGSDGTISCMLNTEPFTATQFKDYIPLTSKQITF